MGQKRWKLKRREPEFEPKILSLDHYAALYPTEQTVPKMDKLFLSGEIFCKGWKPGKFLP